jgi:hypothetical protein
MATQRRNALSQRDALLVAAAAIVAGLLASLAGCQPTGQPIPDAVICFAGAAFVTWASATTPWWALVVASGITATVAVPDPLLFLPALAAGVAAAWIGARQANLGAVRAVIGGLLAQVLLRLDWDPFFTASALVAGGVAVLLVITGLQRRPRDVRSRASRTARVLAAAAGVTLVGFAIAGLLARPSAADGYDRLTAGLDLLRSGDSLGAVAAFCVLVLVSASGISAS